MLERKILHRLIKLNGNSAPNRTNCSKAQIWRNRRGIKKKRTAEKQPLNVIDRFKNELGCKWGVKNSGFAKCIVLS